MDVTRPEDELASLVASRLCHDLISPLSAIGNGVELLGMTAPPGPEMALIAESVENAIARIRFFRIAYGAPAPDQKIGRPEILTTLDALSRGGRTRYDWRPAGDQQRDTLRLVFLLLQCAETALPLGGDVTVTRPQPDWRIEARARRIRLDPGLWAMLTEPGERQRCESARVQFPLAAAGLAATGRRLSLDAGETGFVLTISS